MGDPTDVIDLAIELLGVFTDKEEPEDVPHRFTIDDTDSRGRKLYWYCSKCGQRNNTKSINCVECGGKR